MKNLTEFHLSAYLYSAASCLQLKPYMDDFGCKEDCIKFSIPG